MKEIKEKIKYQIIGGDESSGWGKRLGPLLAEEVRELVGTNDDIGLLLRPIDPLHYKQTIIEYLVVSPRYSGDSLNTLREEGCFAGIGRSLPGKEIELKEGIWNPDNTEYIAIGLCKPIKT